MSDQLSLTFVSTRFLFPTDSGGKIRTTQILRGLKEGAFRVTLVMPVSAHEREQYTEQISTICDELVAWEPKQQSELLQNAMKLIGIFDSTPIPVRSDWDASGVLAVQRILDKKPDVVVFDFLHSAILAPKLIDVPSVMFTHNIEAEIFQRHWEVARFPPYKMIWRDQYRKMQRFEKRELSRFDTVIAVSERDRDFFENEYGTENCRAIPTGVDTEFFSYGPPKSDSQVVFCGSMDWMANIDGVEFFFDKVWPLILRREPQAKMKVVGRAPPVSLIARITASSPEWEFTGFVDDVRDHICGAAAFVIPLRVGGGTRIKAFEAMAMGAPVVSTSIGIEGLPVEDGQHFLAANEPAEIAESVVSLLASSPLRTKISENARELVEKKYCFRNAAAKFEEICLDTFRKRRNRGLH